MLDIQWLLWLIILAALIFYWRDALRVKELAYRAARERCADLDVQLLDETIFLRRIWLKRNARGQMAVWRAFYFEFTVAGTDRYFGRVLMLGSSLIEVQLDPHRLH